MKAYETLKIYGEILNRWTATDDSGREYTTQVELAYREYDSDGRLVNVGSEDFSRGRYQEVKHFQIWGWDGETRMKGGQRWFSSIGIVKIKASDHRKLHQLEQQLHPEYKAIQLRGF